MKPGRELDILIAEKVMDFKYTFLNFGWEKGGLYYDYIPKYSTDIAAAWEIVEKLGNVKVTTYLQVAPKFVVVELFTKSKYDPYSYKKIGESLPHAICLAALKAIGVDIK